ncbi:MAG TPA: glycosyltransferase family 4 protein [Bacteroidales bacterium]|nr:glycosyltransferase family 4 protein [Bacteroidales bacterium]
MKIAQVSPLYESVPPAQYGGTERVVHYLTEQLVADGHQVTLFASADSKTSARLIPVIKKASRTNPDTVDGLGNHFTEIEMVEKMAHEFDIIHSHIDYLYYPVMKRTQHKYLTTLHGRLDIPELQGIYKEFKNIPVVSISNDQRKPLLFSNWAGTVYHGLPSDLYHFNEIPQPYLAFVGRISPEKRVDRVIDLARRTGIPVKIAAKVDKADEEYFENEIRRKLDDPLVEFLGEIDDAEKDVILGNSLASLYLIDWPEPFGLAMIESMACGTPVIAFNCGSVPEVIDEGITGFIVNDMEEAVKAVKKISSIDRSGCYKKFIERFSAERMVRDYIAIYEKLTGNSLRKKIVEQTN